MKLHFENPVYPVTAVLSRDTVQSSPFQVYSNDTLLYIDSLAPGKAYAYTVKALPGKDTALTTIKTLDTTSHSFNIMGWTFGEVSNSIFRDVAIINDHDIWAVGEVYLYNGADPSGTLYNAVYWDGASWKLYQFKFLVSCYDTVHHVMPIDAIYSQSPDSIWMNAGSSMMLYNGKEPLYIGCIESSVVKYFGRNNHDIYGVGGIGRIIHYDGQSWQLQPSGTSMNLRDVWGSADGKTVWACGYYDGAVPRTVLLKNSGSGWQTVYEGNPRDYTDVHYDFMTAGWTDSEYWTYICNGDIMSFLKSNNTFTLESTGPFLRDLAFCMCGDRANNMFYGGQWGLIEQYNGSTYQSLKYQLGINEKLFACTMKDGIVCMVGKKNINLIYNQAVIYIVW
jgi:hypothetical protein